MCNFRIGWEENMEILGRAASELENSVSSWIGGISSSAKLWVGEWKVIQPSAIHLCGYTILALVLVSVGTLSYSILHLFFSRRLKRKTKSNEGKKGSLLSPAGTRKNKNTEYKPPSNYCNEESSLISVQIMRPYMSMTPSKDAGRLVSPVQASAPQKHSLNPSATLNTQHATSFRPNQTIPFVHEWSTGATGERSPVIPKPISPTTNAFQEPTTKEPVSGNQQQKSNARASVNVVPVPVSPAPGVPRSSHEFVATSLSPKAEDNLEDDDVRSLPDFIPQEFAHTENILASLRENSREELSEDEKKAEDDEDDDEDCLDISTSSLEPPPSSSMCTDAKILVSGDSSAPLDFDWPSKSRTSSIGSSATHAYHVDIPSKDSDLEDEILLRAVDRLTSQRKFTPTTIVLDAEDAFGQ